MKNQAQERKERISRFLVIAYMILYVSVAAFTFKDYGWSVDDGIQRKHSLVSYKYIAEKLFGRDLNAYDVFSDIPDLEEYPHKYYGVFLQLPFVAAEDYFDFSLPSRTIFHLRHLGVLCYCCLGYFFFYLFLKKVFKNRGFAFFGLLLISLYPRFFGEKLFNIKDQVFVAVCCLSYYGIALYLENGRKLRYGVLAGAFFAICTSSRMMGVMFPIILVAYLLLQDLRNKAFSKEKVALGRFSVSGWLKCIIDYCSILATYLIVWYLATPVAWGKNVFRVFYIAFTYFGYYDGWNGTSLFAGQNLSPAEMPWHYLYTWIGITVPLYYIVLFFTGHAYLLKRANGIKDWFETALTENKYLSLSVIMFWGPSVLVALHMVKIYTAWRHMFFVMCPFIVLAVYGLKYILEFRNGKLAMTIQKTAICLIAFCMIMQVGWLYINHPYQYVYFNPIGKPVASQFDRDYFRATAYDLIEYMLAADKREKITIGEPSDFDKKLVLLTDAEKARIETVSGSGDYLIQCYRGIAGNDYCPEGYYDYYSIVVDGTKMGTVFKRIEPSEESNHVTESARDVDVIVFAGQSNMCGRGDDLEIAPDVEKGYEFRAISDPTRLYPIEEPFGIAENLAVGVDDGYAKSGGVVASFANAYYEATGVPIVGVSCSQGNTKISEWMPGTSKWNDLINRISLCENYLNSDGHYQVRHVYLVWCQGEADALTPYADYYESLKYFANRLVSDTSVEKVLVIRIGNKSTELDRNDTVMQVQNDLCQNEESFILISTRFAEFGVFDMMKDPQHYTQLEYNLVGKEAGYNAAYYTLNGTQPRIYDYEFDNYFE